MERFLKYNSSSGLIEGSATKLTYGYRETTSARALPSPRDSSLSGRGASTTTSPTRHPGTDTLRLIRASEALRHCSSSGDLSFVPPSKIFSTVQNDLDLLSLFSNFKYKKTCFRPDLFLISILLVLSPAVGF